MTECACHHIADSANSHVSNGAPLKTLKARLRAEQSQRHNGDAVLAAIHIGACGDDEAVENVMT